MNRLAIALATACGLTVSTLPVDALAGGTRRFEVFDFKAFDKGETEGAAIDSSGKVTVGFVPERGDIEGTTAFTCLGLGNQMLVGAADKAAISIVTPTNKRRPKKTKDKKSKKRDDKDKDKDKDKAKAKADKPKSKSLLKIKPLAELDGVVVSAMTPLKGGDILAATLPGGTIYKVSKRGKVSKFAELKVDQIWDMMVHDGRLFVATGAKGELWSISLAGKDAKVVLDSDEKDILSIAKVGNDVVVGTSPGAKLYQVSDELEGILLKDFSGNEVRDITVASDGLIVAVNTFAKRSLSSVDALTKTLNRSSLAGQPPAGSMGSSSPPSADAALHYVNLKAKSGKGLDLARATEAPWEAWLEREKQYFTSILALADGKTVLAASSSGGKIYRVSGPRRAATVADLEERQATGLCRVPKGGQVFATTAHGAAVYQLRVAPAADARYVTEVFDAKHPASYGAVVLRGSGSLKLRARGGPTKEPDGRWSDWKTVRLVKGADGLRGTLSDLPKRRFVQLEVKLDTTDSQLRGLESFYAPENLAPLLKEVEVSHPTFKPSDDDEPGSDVTIKWEVDARDDDKLIYDVRIRPEGTDDSQWVKLNTGGDPVTAKTYKLDLTSVPDGIYEVEVKASDEPNNGSAAAETDELVSAPFVVDRKRPSLSEPKISGRRITTSASDVGGYIHDASYSIDNGKFRTASVADGLFDGPREEIQIDLPKDLEAGKHRVVIRVRDSFGNIATKAVTVSR